MSLNEYFKDNNFIFYWNNDKNKFVLFKEVFFEMINGNIDI